MDPKAFARSISQYDLAPDFLLPVLAIGLPLVEILGAVGLIFAVRGSLSLIFGLLLFFIGVLWYGILNDLDVDCGCFSPEELQAQAGLWQAFYRDLVMIGAAIYLYLSRWVRNGFQPKPALLGENQTNLIKEEKVDMKKVSGVRMGLLVLVSVLLLSSPVLAAWGSKEMDTEKIAVTFAREVERGGYKIVTTEELKGWIDQKKEMLIIDTMPFEDSYKKQHVPGARPDGVSHPGDDPTGRQEESGFRKNARSEQRPADRHLLRLYQMHPQPQRGHVGRQDGLQERLPLSRRHQGLG